MVAAISMPLTSTTMASGIAVGSASMLSWWLTCSSTPPSLTPGASSTPSMCTPTCVWIFSSRRTSSRSMWMISSRTGSSWRSLTITGSVLPSTFRSISAEPSTSTWRRTRAFTLNDDGVLLARAAVDHARDDALAAQAARGAGAALGTRFDFECGSASLGHAAGQFSDPSYPRRGVARRRQLDPQGPDPAHGAGRLGGRHPGRPLRRHARRQPGALARGGRRRAGAPPPRGRRADGRHARAHEGRGDEDRPARLLHRHRVPAARVPRPLPGAPGPAAHRRRRRCPGSRSARCSTRSGRSPARSCSRTSSTRPPRGRRSARCTERCCPTGGGWR